MGVAREKSGPRSPRRRSGVRGPTDATGGSFFSVRGPERHIRGSASCKVFCARPRPRSAFAARSRSTDWPDRNEPPHAPVSRSHVSRCPPNGIAMWDTKCMRGTRPMHPDGSRKGKIGSAFTPPPFGGPRSHGRNGGLVLLGARPRTTYPRLSLLEGQLAAARSRTARTRSQRAPPRPCIPLPHVSRCPPNGIAIWDTKCKGGTRPMHLDGNRKGKRDPHLPLSFGGPRSRGRNGGLVLLGARPRTTYPRLGLLEGVLRTTSS
ncbi:hypothetical protein CRENBAI_001809 [Crenichthys baileyi]|uniref:Uncharacterized protein n=1 Tax=Crenichthys baileyi TaxID=28760 RepID=A0AAV9S8W9_9TELE